MGDALRRWWVPVAMIAVLVGCLGLDQVQRDQRSQLFDGTQGADGTSQVRVTVTAWGIDPAKDQMQLQVDVAPDDPLLDDDGRLLAPLTVHAPELSVPLIELAAGAVPKSIDATVDTSEGIDTDYPIDAYPSEVGFRAETGEAGDTVPVAVSLVGFASSPAT